MQQIEQNKQEYNLSVSQFAQLCNTTRDTLRHYYEIGILLPRIDENNGYHYYAASQISSFYFINTFRMAGCSLKEISSLIHDSSKEKLKQTANEKMGQMEEEVFIILQKINSLKMGLWLLDNYDRYRNAPPRLDTLNNITIYKTAVLDKENATHTKDIAKDIKRHLERGHQFLHLNSFPMGVTISLEDLKNQKYVYNNIISISLESPDTVHTFPLPSQRIVSCFHDHSQTDISDTYQNILKFIQKKKLTICSDLHIISLINLYDTEKHKYLKYLFVCVK